jgi:olefin beta-lactone synthetase
VARCSTSYHTGAGLAPGTPIDHDTRIRSTINAQHSTINSPLNIADRLRDSARKWPWRRAVVCPVGRDRAGRATYAQWTFRQLDQESDRLARGLRVKPGCRMVLMVRPSLEFIALTFALFKAGAVIVLIDPGMGRTNIFKCLEEVDPEGFIAIPAVHWIRTLSRKFPNAKLNVRVGGRWAPGCVATYQSLLGQDTSGRTSLPPSLKPEIPPLVRSGSAGASPSRPEPLEFVFPITRTRPTDPAAVIFTSGSTGPPKGVLYEHGMFDAQVDLLQQFYGIEPGEVDLPGFPLFALFNAAMGVTTVIPDMDPTKPANVDPLKIIEAIRDNGVTQAFGSPALWNRVGAYCVENKIELPSLRRALSAGGPVPVRVLEMMTQVLTGSVPAAVDSPRRHGGTEGEQSAVSSQPSASHTDSSLPPREGVSEFPCEEAQIQTSASVPPCLRGESRLADLHTPYGATESLPVASIGAREVLSRTAAKTRQGAGTCVGRAFPGVDIRIIPITDGPIASIDQTRSLSHGEIGEIIVRSPAVTREYFHRPESTAAAKIKDGDTFWHRIGDVGYLDEEGLLWFCGRKAHIVYTADGPMYSVCCEAIFETHPLVYRAALVGIGERGRQEPVIVIEPMCPNHQGQMTKQMLKEIRPVIERDARDRASTSPQTNTIEKFLVIPAMPVDTRHNVKINREALAVWAKEQWR